MFIRDVSIATNECPSINRKLYIRYKGFGNPELVNELIINNVYSSTSISIGYKEIDLLINALQELKNSDVYRG